MVKISTCTVHSCRFTTKKYTICCRY